MPSPCLSAREVSRFSRTQVQEIFKKAQRVLKLSGLIFLCAHRAKEYGRILIVTPAAMGTAPERNKIRRQLKALFYEKQFFTQGYDMVVLVKKEARELSFEELAHLLAQAIANAQKLVPRAPEKAPESSATISRRQKS